jgi:hypothetical protein
MLRLREKEESIEIAFTIPEAIQPHREMTKMDYDKFDVEENIFCRFIEDKNNIRLFFQSIQSRLYDMRIISE